MPTVIEALPFSTQLGLALIPTLGALFAGVGLLLNVQQSRRTHKQTRAALVSASLKGFIEDEEIQRAFYLIEYSEFRYDGNFHKSVQEREIDKLLRHFSNLALAWEAELLTTKDVRPVQYYILRVLQNEEVTKYLKFIARWSKSQGIGEHPYDALTKMGLALQDKDHKILTQTNNPLPPSAPRAG